MTRQKIYNLLKNYLEREIAIKNAIYGEDRDNIIAMCGNETYSYTNSEGTNNPTSLLGTMPCITGAKLRELVTILENFEKICNVRSNTITGGSVFRVRQLDNEIESTYLLFPSGRIGIDNPLCFFETIKDKMFRLSKEKNIYTISTDCKIGQLFCGKTERDCISYGSATYIIEEIMNKEELKECDALSPLGTQFTKR